MPDQPGLFEPTWRDLPTGPFDRPYLVCPGCKRSPFSGMSGISSGPTFDGGVLVGFTTRNGCCGFAWFEPATPEQVERAKTWGDH